MMDLSAEMAELWASLGAGAPGRPRVLQVASARRGEGASTVARELARYAAHGAVRSVWLVDADLLTSPQHAQIDAQAGRFGALGAPAAATPDGSIFFTVRPPARTRDGGKWPDGAYLVVQRVGVTRLWVTRFRRELLQAGQTVHLVSSPDYWNALRRHVDLVIVDAPSADRSQAAAILSPFMDATVMVVAADQADVKAPALLRDSILGAGGAVAGMFFNRVTVAPPPFLKGVLP